MQPHTTTSGVQTLRPGATESTSSRAASRALRFLRLANDRELPTTATCGPKCIEQFSKSDRAGSWQKMFSGLLIGMEGWFSNRCILTWKLKTTPFKRAYFQLAASTPRIKDTGHGLLPTVTTTNSRQGFNSTNGTGKPLLPMAALMLGTPTATALVRSTERQKDRTPNPAEFAEMVASGQVRMASREEREQINKIRQEPGFLLRMDHGLLPTPKCMDMKGGQQVSGKTIRRKSGTTFSSGLRDLAYSGLLPTPSAAEGTKFAKTYNPQSQMGKALSPLAINGMLPTPTSSCRNAGTAKDRKDGTPRTSELNHLVARSVGRSSQLNPLFVEEMMGFPYLWTALPFLSGDLNQSKPTVTP